MFIMAHNMLCSANPGVDVCTLMWATSAAWVENRKANTLTLAKLIKKMGSDQVGWAMLCSQPLGFKELHTNFPKMLLC